MQGPAAQPPARYSDRFPAAAGGDEGGPNIRRYIAALLRYKWLVIAGIALGLGGGYMAGKSVTARYTAQATIWIETGGGRRGQGDVAPIQQGSLLDSQGWVELMRSFVVLDHVVRNVGLFVTFPAQDSLAFRNFNLKSQFRPGDYRLEVENAGRSFTLKTAERVHVQRGAVGDSVGTELGFEWVPPQGTLRPGSRISFSVRPPRDAALQLQRDLRVEIDRNGNFLRMNLAGQNPTLIAKTVNTTAERYIEIAAELKREKLTELTKILEDQLNTAYRNLRDAEVALESFRVRTITLPTEHGIPVAAGVEQTRAPAFSAFFEAKVEEEQLRRDRESIERVLATVPDSGLVGDALMVVGAVQRSPDLGGALRELTERQAELRSLRYRYSDEHPQIQRLAEEVGQLERREVPLLARTLIREIQAQEATLAARVASGARELREIPTRAIEETRLRREVAIAERLYTTLQSRYEEARLAEASTVPDVRILDAAVVPRRPMASTAQRLSMMIVLAGVGLGVGGAILLDRLDRRVRYPEQVSDELGLTILGAIPQVKGAGNGKGLKGDDALQIVEALRGVRMGLANAYGAAGPMTVTITSPGPGDGKSFVSSNLALAFADSGIKTLLIDGDTRRGELHRLFNVSRKPGLLDLLDGAAPRERVVQSTRYPNLDFIGAGTRSQRGPELLQSPLLTKLLVSLRSTYSVILVDSPPLNSGIDPFVLGTATGNLLLILRSGVTDRDLAGAKLDVLDRLPVRILGAILNDVRPGGVDRYYGYQYYVKGYEARDEEPAGGKKLPA